MPRPAKLLALGLAAALGCGDPDRPILDAAESFIRARHPDADLGGAAVHLRTDDEAYVDCRILVFDSGTHPREERRLLRAARAEDGWRVEGDVAEGFAEHLQGAAERKALSDRLGARLLERFGDKASSDASTYQRIHIETADGAVLGRVQLQVVVTLPADRTVPVLYQETHRLAAGRWTFDEASFFNRAPGGPPR